MEDDRRVEEWAKLIEAISGLVTGLAWPVAIVLAVWLIMRRHRDAFDRLIDRVSSLQFPGGQLDLAAAAAAQQEQVDAFVEQVAGEDSDEAQRLMAALRLAEQAEQLGAIQENRRISALLASPQRFHVSDDELRRQQAQWDRVAHRALGEGPLDDDAEPSTAEGSGART